LFNVPLGKYKNPVICNSNNLRNVSLVLRYSKAMIKISDYKEMLLENAKEGDFIYLDPPYNPASSTAYFTKYTDSGFNNQDQRELADIFRKLLKIVYTMAALNSRIFFAIFYFRH
jgi:DNA adenine methylase